MGCGPFRVADPERAGQTGAGRAEQGPSARVPGQPESSGLKIAQARPEQAQLAPTQHARGAPASEEAVLVWLPSPEKKLLFVAAKRGVSGDPVIKYTSLSCGPRNPCLKANQFPASGGIISVSHPETQIKHHFTDTGHRCFKQRKKEE